MNRILTLIVPAYNMEAYLAPCLDSVAGVRDDLLERIEVIVVNDGSTDGTSRIAHDYEKRYPGLVRVLDKSNGHYGSCINAALRQAEGCYVKILDADDTFDTKEFSEYLNDLKNALDNETLPDVIVTDADIVNSQGDVVSKMRFEFGSDNALYRLQDIPYRFISDLHHHVITFRTGMFKEFQYHQSEGISYTDTQYAILPFLRVETLMPCHRVVYKYLHGREGQTMAAANIARSLIPATAKIALDSLKMYLENRDRAVSECSRDYVGNRIVAMVKGVFEWALLSHRLGECDDVLKNLDQGVRALSPEFYEIVGERSVVLRRSLNCHYVRWFRKAHSSRTLRFYALRGLLKLAGR